MLSSYVTVQTIPSTVAPTPPSLVHSAKTVDYVLVPS